MNEFLLLMKGDDTPNTSPQEMQNRIEAYMAWMKKMLEQGKVKGGQPLEPTGRWLKDKDTVLTDGPFLESKEIIGGYIIVLARDMEEATDIARECPLLHHCEIIVRPMMKSL